MPPKKDIVVKIKDQDHFLQFYSENNQKLSVVDVYVDWAGPCTDLMMSTYKMLTNTYDDWEKRLEFLEVDYEKIKALGLKTHVTCKPKFLLMLEGKIVEEVNGTNVPDLLSKIDKHVPLV